MKGSPTVACLLSAVLVSAASGCSFKLVRPAPPRSDWPEPGQRTTSEDRCTESYMPFVADATFGTIFGSLSYIERNSGSPKVAFVIGAASVPMLISAVYGLVSVSRCRAYKSRFRDAAAGGYAVGLRPRASDLGPDLGLRISSLDLDTKLRLSPPF